MSGRSSDKNRVSRPTYWLCYVGTTILTWGMYGWGIYELFTLHIFPIVFGFAAPFIVGLYFRVIAMRRCRDIGWPTFVPWFTVSLIVVSGLFTGLQVGFHPESVVGTVSASMVAGIVLGLVDFVVLIVIGCLQSANDASNSSSDDHWDSTGMRRGVPSYPVSSEHISSYRGAIGSPRGITRYGSAPFQSTRDTRRIM